MLLLALSLAHADDGACSVELGPAGPTVAGFFNNEPTRGWLAFAAVIDPSVLDERVPIPIPGLTVGVSRTGPLPIRDARYRVGAGYNTLAIHGLVLALVTEQPWAPWVLAAAAEAEAHVLIPAFGPKKYVSFGVRPRGYAVLAVTGWAQSEDPAELWTVLGPTLGVHFGD